MTKLVITTGEPAGIGPEVSVKAAWKSTAPIILVGDRAAWTVRRAACEHFV